MIELVILDFDDTMIDNRVLDYQSFATICKQFKCYTPKKNEVFFLRKKRYLASDIIDWIYHQSKTKFSKKRFGEKRIKFLESKYSTNFLKLRPFVRYTLEFLRRNKIRIVIATLRKNDHTIRLFLKKEKIFSYIDMICNVKNRTNTRKLLNACKQKQKIYAKIMQKYNMDAKRILSIGDSKVDRIVAKKYGIKHLIFKKNAHHKKKSCEISSFIEIKRFIY